MSNELHAAIMNLPLGDVAGLPRDIALYKQGHRDARHAAAELALSRDSEVQRLREALEGLVTFIDKVAEGECGFLSSLRVDDFRTSIQPDSKSVYEAARAALSTKEPK